MTSSNPQFHPTSLASTTYRAYLVRLWRDGAQGAWRASAQSVDGQIIVRFASLEALYAFLHSQTEGNADDDPSVVYHGETS
ncbi:MAG: hypothetical protein R2911_41960 [Caldilineaceae bacterium]